MPRPEVESGVPAGRSLALLAVLIGQGLLIVDLGAVTLAIPAIQHDIGANLADIQLVLAAYSLAFAVLLITGGRLGDLHGRRRLFLLGLAGFTAASVLSACAPSPAALVVARLLAGLSAALTAPQVLAVIQVNYRPEELPKIMARFGVASAIGMIAGQLGAGLLIRSDVFGNGWRVVFVVEAVLGLAAVIGSAVGMRETALGEHQSLDLQGVGVLSVGLGLLVYPLVMAGATGWEPWVWACLTASLPVLAGFIVHEQRLGAAGGSPLLDLRLFRVRAFSAGLTLSVAFFTSVPPLVFLFTLLVQIGLGYDPFQAGAMFACTALAFLLASHVAPRLVDAMGRNALILAGLVNLAGTAVLVGSAFVFGDRLGPLTLVPGLCIGGIGQGLTLPPLMTFVMGEVPHEDAGSAGGAFSTVQQLGVAVGVTLVGLVFAATLDPVADASAYARAFGLTLLLYMAPLNLVMLALVPLLPRVRHGGEVVLTTAEAPA
jgi:MFS family permease